MILALQEQEVCGQVIQRTVTVNAEQFRISRTTRFKKKKKLQSVCRNKALLVLVRAGLG